MDKVKEVVAKVTHKDTATHNTGSHTTGTHNTTSGATGSHGTAGPHQSNMANKVDPTVDSDMDGSRNMGAAKHGPGAHNAGHSTGAGLTGSHNTAGPHSSDAANRADPRVDSDLDNSRNAGAATYGSGASHTGMGTGSSNNAGPHNSSMMNKMDSRVDSDRDGSRNMGAAQHGPGAHTGATHGTGMTGSGAHSSGLTGSHTGSANAGPHNSSMMNKADPRVDSDRDGSRNMGAATGSTGMSGSHGSHGTTGMTGSHGTHGTGLMSDGPAPNTAGPHKQDMMNKLDPRVDSDHDGSKTIGQQKY